MKVNLGSVATYVNGFAFKPSDWSDEGVPIIRIQDLTGNAYQANRFNGKYQDKYEVNEGDVLISWSASLGVYVWHGEKAVLNQHIFKVVFDKVEVDKSFFVHQVQSILENAVSEAHGATMKHLTKPVFDALPFYLPNIETQKKIATVLDKISNLITLRKEQLAKLDQLVKARFAELLQPYFDNGKTEPLVKLVCEDRPITYGILKPGTHYEGGYPVIRVKDFSRGLVNVKEVLHTTPEIYTKYLRSVLAEDDVIISIGGTIGRIAVIPQEFVGANITQHTARIALKDKRYILYFRGLLESDIMQRWMKERVLGVAQPSINLGDVKQMPIPVVDECVMKELNALVEQTDKSKSKIQASLDKLGVMKIALMQEYFG